MYKILQDPDNDLLLVIEPQDCEPDGPMFIYDGGDTALLFRDWFSNVRLNDIGSDAREQLLSAQVIYVMSSKSLATPSPANTPLPSASSAMSKA